MPEIKFNAHIEFDEQGFRVDLDAYIETLCGRVYDERLHEEASNHAAELAISRTNIRFEAVPL